MSVYLYVKSSNNKNSFEQIIDEKYKNIKMNITEQTFLSEEIDFYSRQFTY
jgi:hypothetical protein